VSLPFNPWFIYGPVIGLILIVMYRRKLSEEWTAFRTRRKEWLYEKWKNWGEPFLIAAVLALVIRTFLLGPYKIPTGSMRMTFLEGDRIFVDKVSYRFHTPRRGDIIVFKYPMDPKKDFVKRLIGMPGDRLEIRGGKILVNDQPLEGPPYDHYYYNRNDWEYAKEGQVIEVPAGHYFALGDNSAASSDSRNWGFVPAKNLVGKAFFIWWPPNRVKLVQ
jgi:signal peptidase I